MYALQWLELRGTQRERTHDSHVTFKQFRGTIVIRGRDADVSSRVSICQ
jgi:hypothetical protein